METILTVMGIYLAIYGIEWLSHTRFTKPVPYVSWETWSLFVTGQILLVFLYINTSSDSLFFSVVDGIAITGLLGVMLAATKMFHVEHERVCTIGGRFEQCLSPLFVLVKSAEIVFQQLVYLILVLEIASFGVWGGYGYIMFTTLVLLLHLPLLARVNLGIVKFFILGSVMVSVSAYYVYSTLGMFWPAIFVHAMLHVFYWITFSDMGLGKTRRIGG